MASSLGFNPFTGGQANFGVNFQGSVLGAPVQQFQGNPLQMQQFQQLLQAVIGALAQLFQGYQGFGGGQQPGFPGQQPGFPGQQPGFPGQPPGGFGYPGPAGPIPTNPFGPQPSPGTPVFGGPQRPTAPPGSADWTQLNNQQRTQLSGMNDTQRAALHLWGIQTGSEGKNNGGVYFNVLNNPQNFKPAEVALVRDLYQREMAMYGGVTGKLLDQAFFGVYQDLTGKDISQRYGNRPVEFATGPVNMDNRVTGNNGLSGFDNAVIRLWGHDSLDNGLMDGSVVELTARGGANALDKGLNQGDLNALLAADAADNGTRDGTALESAMIDAMDRIYFGNQGAQGASQARTLQRAGINQNQVGGILNQLSQRPIPGIPPGVDFTNMANIGKCPVLGGVVSQQGGAGGIQF